ncbi:unnamed protein product [Brassica rapa subsp. trilocularis]|uniref:(rape) hypothetical protein n=1 Tax=Brassica napus TaxID=3708 RepID=A0A816S989_BRANA|nr:unnamed protein product [Brassica napus]
MGSTKTFMTCLLVVTLAVSLSNNLNVLVSEKKLSYEHCNALCSPTYDGWSECQSDCAEKGYYYGACASPSPKLPKKCCCQTFI